MDERERDIDSAITNLRRLGVEVPAPSELNAADVRYLWYEYFYDDYIALAERLYLVASRNYGDTDPPITEADRRALRKEARSIEQAAESFLYQLDNDASELAAASAAKFRAAKDSVDEAEEELNSEIERWGFWSRTAKHVALAASALAAFA